ncbi:methionyl-tRNA synthetase [Microdochium trichocladiopsis]|uniref:Probable methionine--tRNA ligase, mitochondrial n=1 Tax=Microdochium trichocladiopsis TaxID=1682393 RepID=A0A9P8YA12_9PEZI|nr:methionyl-tRNA synthetase [Microdochium trichocladiopsis]KAH7033441.1 methionyl-tRNA synthetase [Microdochium trichocladiopsis]
MQSRLYSSSNNNSGSGSAAAAPGQEPRDKPYYVTTPIFYVNAAPHVGHLYSMVLADVLKRWQVLKGEPAILCTGTDEHGMKVQQAAQQQNMLPKALCDVNSQTFRDLAVTAKLDNDHFVRTTDPDHRAAVQYFWERLVDSGYIYEKTHAGYYCVSDETFYPEDLVALHHDGMTGKVQHVSTETGNVVEWTEERNYYFRLTALRERLLEFFAQNPEWVTPPSRMAEVVEWVKNHLEDLSVSRPLSRLDWGIPVPGDESQTIYVWVDALVNYLTMAGYPLLPPGEEHKGGWPADVHVVGKDIVRFHCVYWPALLMAVGLPLPKRVLSHGHWLMDNRKMSKSVGNVVNPFFAIERYGLDTIRYFLMLRGTITHDPDYSNLHIVQAYKKGLQTGLGNLVSRLTKGRAWSVRTAVQNRQPHGLTDAEPSGSLYRVQWQHAESIRGIAEEHMVALAPPTALRRIMDVIFETNKYMAHTEPWALAKDGNIEETEKVIYLIAESVRIAAILLQPFIPDKAVEILDRLGVRADRRGFEYAQIRADDAYGMDSADRKGDEALFPPLPIED